MTPMSNAVVDDERSSAKSQDGAPGYASLSGPNYQLSTRGCRMQAAAGCRNATDIVWFCFFAKVVY